MHAVHASVGTEAILYFTELKRRKERRKIRFRQSDGEPWGKTESWYKKLRMLQPFRMESSWPSVFSLIKDSDLPDEYTRIISSNLGSTIAMCIASSSRIFRDNQSQKKHEYVACFLLVNNTAA